MTEIKIRTEEVRTKDFFVVRTLFGENRIFEQGAGLKKTLITATGASGSGPGATANFYTGGGSGSGQVINKSMQSSAGSVVPTTTIESVQEDS